MNPEKIVVGAIVDPLAARVIVDEGEPDPDRVARFDVAGVPRVDGFLVGKQAAKVPTLVTRLCGLCPVTHHLAGMAALDDLVQCFPPEGSRAVRLLMHHGSVLDVMGPRLVAPLGRPEAIVVRAFGKKVLALSGVPGHFPDVATPGGVRVEVLPDQAERERLRAEIKSDLPEVRRIVDAVIGTAENAARSSYAGADVIVVDENGTWDPLGRFLKATYRGESRIIPASAVPQRIRETEPGSIAPRPQLEWDGEWISYRVGPAARYPKLPVAQAQARSLIDSVDAIADLLSRGWEAPEGGLEVAEDVSGVGIGLVDGPRGVLIHRYTVAEGVLVGCEILSPTAQNEPWLAAMLSQAYREGEGVRGMELAVRAADPCLPCTQAPPGMMNLHVEVAGE